jgi:hypothetical protein
MTRHEAARLVVCALAGYVFGLLIGGRVHPLVGLFGLMGASVLFLVTVAHEREDRP